MKTEKFTTTIITADDNMYLTQVENVGNEKRIVAKTVAIGKYDSVDNWKEISENEAQKLMNMEEDI